jgi:hypothetical protein
MESTIAADSTGVGREKAKKVKKSKKKPFCAKAAKQFN